MKKVTIAFDIDGTLRANREERHRDTVEANPRIVELLIATAHSKNVEVHLWSNRGAEYCQEMREILGLQKYIKASHCHKKLWLRDQLGSFVDAFKNTVYYPKPDVFRPDIAYDDQQHFDGGVINIVVREK